MKSDQISCNEPSGWSGLRGNKPQGEHPPEMLDLGSSFRHGDELPVKTDTRRLLLDVLLDSFTKHSNNLDWISAGQFAVPETGPCMKKKLNIQTVDDFNLVVLHGRHRYAGIVRRFRPIAAALSGHFDVDIFPMGFSGWP